MKITKANKRDKKQFKRKNGMRVSGKSVFIIQATQIKKGSK
jgi:phosphotransferase system HPr-like phosphotransfer protein